MKIELSYRDLSLIRELVKQCRDKEINELLSKLKKDTPFSEIQYHIKLLKQGRNEWCLHEQCGIILDNLEVVEDQCQGAMNNE